MLQIEPVFLLKKDNYNLNRCIIDKVSDYSLKECSASEFTATRLVNVFLGTGKCIEANYEN